MRAPDRARAVAAAAGSAASLGLAVDDVVVLHDSNKLTLRLLPGDVVARVAPASDRAAALAVAAFEVDTAQRLAARGAPVARPDPRVAPRVHERDGFALTWWTFHEPVREEVPPAESAHALLRLHAAARGLDVGAPHARDRLAVADALLADRDRTPALPEADRAVLRGALREGGRVLRARGGADQLLHGEPHPGNLVAAAEGPLFVDFETCCRGPVEFDLAHAPDEVAAHYPGLDEELLHWCRVLVLAVITTWRWDRDDLFPDGPRRGREWLAQLRSALAR